MKKILFLTATILLINSTVAQSKFRLGVSYNLGASDIMSSGNSMSGMGSGMTSNAQMSSSPGLKLNQGVSLRSEYFIDNKWGLYFQTGYQQRGGIYREYMDNYKPRYRLQYWDVNLGVQFRTKGILKGHQFVTNLGITQHTLLSANRVYDMGDDNIVDEFNRNDIGVFFGVGENVPVFKKDIFQIIFYANLGLKQMYSGIFELNGMKGRNLLFGIQLSYLMSKPVNKE